MRMGRRHLVWMLLAALCVVGCGPALFPSERTCYKIACEALRSDPDIPGDARPLSIRHAQLHVLKNAARVDLPYEATGPDGTVQTDTYIVWLKRIARRWVADRSFRAPKYDANAE